MNGKREGIIFSPSSLSPLRIPADVYDGYMSRPEAQTTIPISVGNMRRGYKSLVFFKKTPHKAI
jgi:hypothetical protein